MAPNDEENHDEVEESDDEEVVEAGEEVTDLSNR
jgi:hypothetical protein